MYMRRSWYPPTSEARKTELQPESPESQRFLPRLNWAPPSHGGDSTSSDAITTMKCSRQRITYHSVPSGLAGLNNSMKKVALDNVPRRARRVAHMI
jgi:hypothetical protein